jgi:hypothetical protein
LGHQVVGRVDKLGPGVSKWRQGVDGSKKRKLEGGEGAAN